MATMPHCDSAVLHAPGECEYCDAFPQFQEARRMWGIAFTGQPPTDKQPLPCPSEVHRDLDVINRWPGNRPTPIPTATATAAAADAAQDDADHEDWSVMTVSNSQLGRPNIPVLKRDLEALIREIVKDILREHEER